MSINITMPINNTRPKTNNQFISYATLNIQNNILNDKANIIFPINLLRATVSYLFCSSGDIVLYPAIREEPLPLIKTIPNITNSEMQAAIIIIATILSSIFFPPPHKFDRNKAIWFEYYSANSLFYFTIC